MFTQFLNKTKIKLQSINYVQTMSKNFANFITIYDDVSHQHFEYFFIFPSVIHRFILIPIRQESCSEMSSKNGCF